MPVTFGPAGGTDRVAGGSHAAPTNWTIYGWFRRASGTGGQLASISDTVSGNEFIGIYWSGAVTDLLRIDRLTSATPGNYQVAAANLGFTPSASKWIFVAVTQAGTANPVVYTASPADGVALASRTVQVNQAPTGTADTSTGKLYLGNWQGADYALAGDMAWWGLHNAVLTLGELQEAMLRGMTLRSLVEAPPLEAVAKLYDLSGNAASYSSTGIADLEGGPPVTPLWMPTPDGWAPLVQASAVPMAASVVSDTLVTVSAEATLWMFADVQSDTLVTASMEVVPIELSPLPVQSDTLVTVAAQAITLPHVPYGRDLSDGFDAGAGDRGVGGSFGAAGDDRETTGIFLP